MILLDQRDRRAERLRQVQYHGRDPLGCRRTVGQSALRADKGMSSIIFSGSIPAVRSTMPVSLVLQVTKRFYAIEEDEVVSYAPYQPQGQWIRILY